MQNNITLRSKRTKEEYSVELFQKNETVIVRHASLENIFWSLPDKDRPIIEFEPWNMENVPGVYAVLLKMSCGNFHIQQIGEFTFDEWKVSNPIAHSFPLTTCANRAFDRAFIRYMQFDISAYDVSVLYSTAEIPLDSACVKLTERGISTANTANVSLPGTLPGTVPESFGFAKNSQHVQTDNTMRPMQGQGRYPASKTLAGNPSFQHSQPGNNMQSMQAGYTRGGQSVNVVERPVPKRKPSVYRVSHNVNTGKTLVETDMGCLFFDPFQKKWESNTVDVNSIDISHIYRVASDYVKMPLERFNGPAL